jgi:four helix bundle protein
LGPTRGETQTQAKESLMQSKNVYDKARGVVREMVPLLRMIREQDKSLADQMRRAAQSVVLNIAEGRGSDAGNARARFSTACGSAKEVRAALNVASDWGVHRRSHGDPPRREARRGVRHHMDSGPKALAAGEPPGHRVNFIERGVHRLDLRVWDVPVRYRELEAGSHLFRRAAC